MNTLTTAFLALIWAGGCWVSRWVKGNSGRPALWSASPISLKYVLLAPGGGLFAAWLVRIIFVPVERWGITDILTFLLLSFGFYLLTSGLTIKKTFPNILETLPNHYGVFHLRLGDRDHPGPNWADHTLSELDLRKKNLLVLAIIRDQETIPFPKGPETLRRHDELLIFGAISELQRS